MPRDEEAAIEGIDLVSVDSARSVTTELSQVEELIARRVDLIVMMSVDQKMSQAAAKLINKAGIALVLLTTKFADDFTSSGGKFVTYVGSDDIVAGEIQGHYLADKLPAGGNVIYLVLEYGMSATARRKAGFESVIKDYPNLYFYGRDAPGDQPRVCRHSLRARPLDILPVQQVRWRPGRNFAAAVGPSAVHAAQPQT